MSEKSNITSWPEWPEVAPQTTIVVPTYNEADNVLPLVERVRRALNGRPAEILFVDDSKDMETIKAIDTAGGLFGTASFHVKSYHRTGEKRWGGLSGAVSDGIANATCDQVIIMDGDLQHPPEYLPKLIEAAAADDGYDVVIASRYREGGKADGLSNGIRHIVSRGSTMLAKGFFPKRLKGVTDPMTGYFLVNRKAVDLSKLNPKGFKILLEILARHDSLKVTEIPFEFASRNAGESKGTLKQGLQYFDQLVTVKNANNADTFTAMPKFIQFALVGGGVFAVGMAMQWALVSKLGWNPVRAYVLQLAVTFALNYLLNRNLTWRERTISRLSSLKFFFSRGVTSVLNGYMYAWLIALNTTVAVLGQTIHLSVHYLAAMVICLGVITVLNYVVSDRWAFADVADKPARKLAAKKQLRKVRDAQVAASNRRTIIVSVLWASVTGAILAWGLRTDANMTVSAVLALASLAMFAQSSIEIWRNMYTYREPEAVDRMRFPTLPEGGQPTEKFALIVPARHEDAVLADTLRLLARQSHPNVDIISVMCDDDFDTIKVAREVADEIANVEVIQYPLLPDVKPSKPLQMNYVLDVIKDRGYTVVGVIDAEDTVAPDLLMRVDAAFQDKSIDIVQGGVQLMNHDSSWYSLHNVLEYYRWFSSAFAFHADMEFTPLGGNTIFVRHDLLQQAGGWPTTLTEDCSLGVILSTRYNSRTAIYYEPQLATQEETPDTLQGLFKQRVRWNQGFYHEWRRGIWRELPTLRQRLLAGYVLLGPVILAWSSIILVASLIATAFLSAPVGLVMLMFLPLVPMTLLLALNAVFLYDFGKAFSRKVQFRSYALLFATYFLYQIVLNTAALWSIVRELRGDQSWHKTAHSGLHRRAEPAFATADATVMAKAE